MFGAGVGETSCLIGRDEGLLDVRRRGCSGSDFKVELEYLCALWPFRSQPFADLSPIV